MMRKTILTILLFTAWVAAANAAAKPNIVFILADDLGYGDLGCFGQKIIQTPRLDQMAAEGMKFTQFYAGSTVCAPSRSVLMTGKHTGHTSVRGNGQGAEQALKPGDVTVAEVLKGAGYATALVGKWGLGDDRPGTDHAIPNKEGFDYFFGYLNQVHAHNYYPEFLWRNGDKIALGNVVEPAPNSYGGFQGGAASKKVAYSHDLFAAEAMDWVRKQMDHPFFLYLSLTIPHANNEAARMHGNGAEVPDYGSYADKDWPDPDKGQAAMITRMDRDVGRLLDLLRELKIAENTLVIFTSDNGPHNESRHNPDRFNPTGPLTGMKRTLTEGGIRVPTIMWWPGVIKPGGVSDHISYFGDFMATAAALAGAKVPDDLDSISFLPTLTGKGRQAQHEYLYWEFYEQGSRQAVRFGDWKAIREPMLTGTVKLYNVKSDLAEQMDVAAGHPKIVQTAIRYMDEAHVADARWQVRGN